MANRLPDPNPQFADSTGAPYSGGTLTFYASGTSTPLAVYTDSSLSTSGSNPHTLGSDGRPQTDIFLQNLAYKVVLKDSSGNTIWTKDPVSTSDYTTWAALKVNAGNPNGSVAGTAGSGSVLADAIYDITNNILYICTTTGSSSTAVWTAINSSTAANVVPQPQGRLTLVSGSPGLTGSATSATAVYYAPYVGNIVPIYNGSTFVARTFAELTLTLNSNHSASTIYDVFAFNNSGVVTLATGPAWSNSSTTTGARGSGAGTTQLQLINGLWVNAVSMTGRNGATTYSISANQATYLGSIFVDGSAGQVTCHGVYGQNRKWGVWNAYNRLPLTLLVSDDTASWTYASATARALNNSSSNKATVFVGLRDEFVVVRSSLRGSLPPGAAAFSLIGWSSTSSSTGLRTSAGNSDAANSISASAFAEWSQIPALGITDVYMLEATNAADTVTFSGTPDNCLMTMAWRV